MRLRRTGNTMTTSQTKLVKSLEGLIDLIEKRVQDVTMTDYISSQEPFADIGHCLWNIRRGDFSTLLHLSMLLGRHGPISSIATRHGWNKELEAIQEDFRDAFAKLHRIRYFATEVPVELGDHVAIRMFFKTRRGRVTYVSGSSKPNDEIDFGGILHIGIDVPGEMFVAYPVDPRTFCIRKSVVFERRDAENTPASSFKGTFDL